MIEQAAYWAAQLATDEATQDDRNACDDWCREHPLHRLAMDRMRGLDAQFDSTDRIGRETIETILEGKSHKSRWQGGLTLGLALLAAGGWFAAQSMTVRAWFPDYETVRGEQREITLADGSGVTIDTNGAIDFRRDGDRRTVTLFRGRILARVAKDKARPFVVETRDGTVTARGTAFIVSRDDDATVVSVIESVVRACLETARPQDCVDLSPGEQVRMAQGRVERLGQTDPETAGLWAEGWLAADDQPVVQVLNELNRYRQRPVRFDPGELEEVTVSGSFPLADTDRALDGIARSTGLHLSRTRDGVLAIGQVK